MDVDWDDPVIKAQTAKAVLATIREVLADPEITDVERVELISDAMPDEFLARLGAGRQP